MTVSMYERALRFENRWWFIDVANQCAIYVFAMYGTSCLPIVCLVITIGALASLIQPSISEFLREALSRIAWVRKLQRSRYYRNYASNRCRTFFEYALDRASLALSASCLAIYKALMDHQPMALLGLSAMLVYLAVSRVLLFKWLAANPLLGMPLEAPIT